MKSFLKNVGLLIFSLAILFFLMKISGWSPLNLLFGPQYEKRKAPSTSSPSSIHSVPTQPLWWTPEYSDLLKCIDASPNKEMITSYRTGPEGASEVHLILSKKETGLLLRMKLPKEALVTYDERGGKTIPSEIVPLIEIRDKNLDGKPDDFIMKTDRPGPNAIQTTDEFIKLQERKEHEGIFIQWAIGIGFSINHFLHGIDSAYPREK